MQLNIVNRDFGDLSYNTNGAGLFKFYENFLKIST